MAEFKDRLFEALNKRDIKMTDLAKRLKVSRSTISQYCNGQIKPKRDRVFEIAKILNINPVWLLGYDVPITQTSPDYFFNDILIESPKISSADNHLSQYLVLLNSSLNESELKELKSSVNAFVDTWLKLHGKI